MNLSKVYKIVIVIIAILLVVGLWLNLKNDKKMESTLETIATRTSIRAYQNRTIASDTIEMILRAGMAAPTAMNKQPWAFVVVNDKKLLKEIADSLPNAKMAALAPVAIVACGDTTKMLDGDAADYWIQDVSAATQNMLLAAHALGIGAVWTGVYPIAPRVEIVRSILNLPSNLVPLNIIPMGYPKETPIPKDKWNPEAVHYNAFEGDNKQ